MSEIEIAVSYLTMIVGLGLAYYFGKRRLISGAVFGMLCFVMGLLLFGGLSGFVSGTGGVALAFAVVFAGFITFFFVSGRRPRTLLLLVIPALLLLLFLL